MGMKWKTIIGNIVAFIINLVFGVCLFYSTSMVLISLDFSKILLFGIEAWIFSIIWIALCYIHNKQRYKRVKRNSSEYGKTVYFLTLLIPLLTPTAVMFLDIFLSIN